MAKNDIATQAQHLLPLLEKMKVQTGSLVCLGCGHEHGCSVHGCTILREATELTKVVAERSVRMSMILDLVCHDLSLCKGHPGAMDFMFRAYEAEGAKAHEAFQRMAQLDVSGADLSILWSDCCDRIMDLALQVMRCDTADSIRSHINSGGVHGLPYSLTDIARLDQIRESEANVLPK